MAQSRKLRSPGALMHQVQLVYDERANANDRIFEGLKFEAPGRYSIESGS